MRGNSNWHSTWQSAFNNALSILYDSSLWRTQRHDCRSGNGARRHPNLQISNRAVACLACSQISQASVRNACCELPVMLFHSSVIPICRHPPVLKTLGRQCPLNFYYLGLWKRNASTRDCTNISWPPACAGITSGMCEGHVNYEVLMYDILRESRWNYIRNL